MICLLIFSQLVVRALGQEQTYSERVRNFLYDLSSNYSETTECWVEALKQFSSQSWSHDKLNAIILINLYTQNCQLDVNGENQPFYQVLNRYVCQNQTLDPESLWTEAKDLLEMGVKLLGETKFSRVFIGCSAGCLSKVGQDYITNQFTSASLSREKAMAIALSEPENGGQRILYTFYNATGVSIAEYSSFMDDDAILIRPGFAYTVADINNISNKTGNFILKIAEHSLHHGVERFSDNTTSNTNVTASCSIQTEYSCGFKRVEKVATSGEPDTRKINHIIWAITPFMIFIINFL